MMARLTGWIRNGILNKLTAHRFDAEFAAINVRERALGEKIYHDIFSEAEIELMASLPEGWLLEQDSIGIQFSGYHYGSIELPSLFRFPMEKSCGCLKSYDGGTEFAAEWEKILADRADVKSRRVQARAAASAILESVTTTAALLSKWPEVAPFLPAATEVHQLPALPIDNINKLLGLPAEETEKVS
jgi:hypothetical protein